MNEERALASSASHISPASSHFSSLHTTALLHTHTPHTSSTLLNPSTSSSVSISRRQPPFPLSRQPTPPPRPSTKMLALSALITLLPALASAATCVQFDSDKNLYAFGGEQDVSFGTVDTWGCELLVCCCCEMGLGWLSLTWPDPGATQSSIAFTPWKGRTFQDPGVLSTDSAQRQAPARCRLPVARRSPARTCNACSPRMRTLSTSSEQTRATRA